MFLANFTNRVLRRLVITTRMALSTNQQRNAVNRLSKERSPYLLQHASNPVDWYPWGEEAFRKAVDENKLIFLSVGYSTCHWCHVMERESFENEGVAKIMNENFVCVKVDREERPDVDKIYMAFVQATSGRGGWPMSVWLTPDLKPVIGGTYFPPDDVYYGRPGFSTVLKNISQKWREDPAKFQKQGSEILEALKKLNNPAVDSEQSVPSENCIALCFQQLSKTYDPEFGGFGNAPKFPQPVNLRFLMRMLHGSSDEVEKIEISSMVSHTLKMMAKGGMHDHVGQGFHRYSTDGEWHVPHFEKMLYDQAQLAVVYAEAYQLTKNTHFKETAQDILHYVNRDLSSKTGGFYSAEDADSLPTAEDTVKKEGAFCVWSYDEIQRHLAEKIPSVDVPLADVFSHHYDVQETGNVDPMQDPHDELRLKNVLMEVSTVEETAEYFNLGVDQVKELLQTSREILLKERLKRPRPHLDDKIVTAWNGLMISAFAKCGQAFSREEYTNRAELAAEFVHRHLYDDETKRLLRSCYCDQDGNIVHLAEPIEGFVDDYTFLIHGLLDLYESNFDSRLLKWAEELQEMQDDIFWDTSNGAYFSTGLADKSLVLRMKDDQDGAEPCANSVATGNLVRLGNLLDRKDLLAKAEKMLKLYGDRLEKIPMAVPEMMCGLISFLGSPKQIIIVGKREDEETQAMVNLIGSHFLPNKIVILANGAEENFLYERLDILQHLSQKEGKPTAYVCENFTCSLPVNDLQELEKLVLN
ncbi:spermatogenesis-associated protein 20-like [Tubulanus polymorphus]|uniref:spermatogenesis-associated protein 20-like n=1 Tax=Tubulanus polymorphus TaxID=672921 RepID=UPI003DA4711F